MINKSKKISISVIVAIILMLFAGVFIKNRTTPATMENKIKVTTSFYPIHFLVSEIGGDFVSVDNLTPAGSEPHDYELTAQDVIRIKKSKLLFLNGGGLEVWGEKIKKNMNNGSPKVITLGEGLMAEKDPHIWLSPKLMIKMAEKITTELVEVDLKNKEYYQTNLNTLKSKLASLDGTYLKTLEKCQRRDFITSHEAFGYLAKEYNLQQVAIAGISPEEEPSIAQLAQVANFAKENQVKYIFFESLLSPKLAETIAKEVGAQTLALNPIEGLSEEEMAQGKNYLTEMETNLGNLKKALECE